MTNEKRLIDANAIPKLFERKFEETEQRILDGETYLDTLAEGFTEADDVILAMPTIDAVEVKHGRWDEIEEEVWHLYKRWPMTRFRCSKCKQMENKKSNYCPNCGAKMDGDGNV